MCLILGLGRKRNRVGPVFNWNPANVQLVPNEFNIHQNENILPDRWALTPSAAESDVRIVHTAAADGSSVDLLFSETPAQSEGETQSATVWSLPVDESSVNSCYAVIKAMCILNSDMFMTALIEKNLSWVFWYEWIEWSLPSGRKTIHKWHKEQSMAVLEHWRQFIAPTYSVINSLKQDKGYIRRS